MGKFFFYIFFLFFTIQRKFSPQKILLSIDYLDIFRWRENKTKKGVGKKKKTWFSNNFSYMFNLKEKKLCSITNTLFYLFCIFLWENNCKRTLFYTIKNNFFSYFLTNQTTKIISNDVYLFHTFFLFSQSNHTQRKFLSI